VLAFCARYDLPTPKINTFVHGHEADAYFEAEKVIVEYDGWEFQSDRMSFESNRDRDATMLMHGIVTIRLTAESDWTGSPIARLPACIGSSKTVAGSSPGRLPHRHQPPHHGRSL
jgi:hypothetical protein